MAVALPALAGSMATATQFDRFQTNPLENREQPVSHSWAYADAIDPHGQQWKCYAQGIAEWDCFKPKNNSYGVKTSAKHRADERNFWGIPLDYTRFEYGNSWVGGADAYNNALPGWLWHKRVSAVDNLSNRFEHAKNGHTSFFGTLRSGLSSVFHTFYPPQHEPAWVDDAVTCLHINLMPGCHDENKRDLTNPDSKDVDHIRLPTKWAVNGEYHSWYKYHTLNYVDPAGAANSFNLLAGGEWKFWPNNNYAIPYLEVMVTHANKLNGRDLPIREIVVVDNFQTPYTPQVWDQNAHPNRFNYRDDTYEGVRLGSHGSVMEFVIAKTTAAKTLIHTIDVTDDVERDVEDMCSQFEAKGYLNKPNMIFTMSASSIIEDVELEDYNDGVDDWKDRFNAACGDIKGIFFISVGNIDADDDKRCTDAVERCSPYVKGLLTSAPSVSGQLHVVPVTSYDSDTGYISISKGPGPEALVQNNTVTMFGQYDYTSAGTTSTATATMAGLTAIHSSIYGISPQESLDRMLNRTWRGEPYIGGRGVTDIYDVDIIAGHYQSGAWGDHPQAYGRGVLDIGKAFQDGNRLHSWLYQTQGQRSLWSGGRNVRHAEYDAEYDAVRVEVPFNAPSIRYAPRSDIAQTLSLIHI